MDHGQASETNPQAGFAKTLNSPWPKGLGFGGAPFLGFSLASKRNPGPILVTHRLLTTCAPDKKDPELEHPDDEFYQNAQRS